MSNIPSAAQPQKANPFNLTEEEILTLVHDKQYPNDQSDVSLDENKLLILVQNILKRSTQIVDEVLVYIYISYKFLFLV